MDHILLLDRFKQIYGEGDYSIFFAPGRVNLIGEHTDYNGGFVLPCALGFGTILIIKYNTSNRMRLASTNFDFQADLALEEISDKIRSEWVNYPLGVIGQFVKRGIKMRGFDMLFSGDIPNGAGLSSSASIEIATAVALDDMLQSHFDRIELVKIGRAAENEFVGMNCGIMDQFAVGMGRKNSALYLNCRTLDYENVEMNLQGYSIVIANTNKRRELADSKYNERVSECTIALEALRMEKPMIDLSDIDLAGFTAAQKRIGDNTIRRRARHVISENERVKNAVIALKKGDLCTFGQLMNQSHQSLKEDYEVTGLELDTIVGLAQSVKGVIGARMTGAGFGGCSVNIVKTGNVDEFIEFVGTNYKERTGLTADFYLASLGDGAGKIE
jgi:galactokinase